MRQIINKIWEKIKYFLYKLSSKPEIGGLEISDSGIQYVSLANGQPKTLSLRFPPGVLKDGRIIDEKQFSKILTDLHNLLQPTKPNNEIPIIVSLPSSVVYTQVINIPIMDKNKIDESARLNLQMISPMPIADTYMSYEFLGEAADGYELLGAFAEKALVDKLNNLLNLSRFYSLAFEFPALALARVVHKDVYNGPEPILVFQVSSDGLNFLIMKNGALRFGYFRSWSSIQGDKKEMSRNLFDQIVLDEIQKVSNFALSKFRVNLKQVFVIAPGFETEIKNVIASRFVFPVFPLNLNSYNIAPSWYGALGVALRGTLDRASDEIISLSADSSSQLYYQEQILNFIKVWRNIFGGAFGIFILVFGGAAIFLVNQTKNLNIKLEGFKSRFSQEEYATLKQEAEEFNIIVGSISRAKGMDESWHSFITAFKKFADGYGVSLDKFDLITNWFAFPRPAFPRSVYLEYLNEIIWPVQLF